MTCTICNTRKAKRDCPAAQSAICAQCCAEQREETLDCPLDCEHLVQARLHAKYSKPAGGIPHADIELTESFLNSHDMLIQFLSVLVRDAAVSTAGLTDADLREGIDALIQSYKTAAGSGLIYDARPANPFAAQIQEKVKLRIAELNARVAERGGTTLRDKDILGVLVFIARVASGVNNGRRKGRAFVGWLLDRFPVLPPAEGAAAGEASAPVLPASNLIVTG
ncbi:MAG: hypothetical protein IT162_03975 [Bryobacterales bacterium]|nr:hypothetical protein [Bryobacterales bacterium]